MTQAVPSQNGLTHIEHRAAPKIGTLPRTGTSRAAVLGWLVAALTLGGCVGPAAQGPLPADAQRTGAPQGTRVGQLAPAFDLPRPDGANLRLTDLRGKTVLINFWASWCVPCRQEMPQLEAVHRSQGSRDVVVLGINSGEPPSVASAFARDLGITFTIVLDQDGIVTVAYEALGLPVSYFVDRDGVLRDRYHGEMTRSEMEARLDKTHAAAGRPVPTPVAVTTLEGRQPADVAATVGLRRITRGEVDRRLDLQLAFDRFRTGQVLDIASPAGRTELDQRWTQVLEKLVDEELLTRGAMAAGLSEPLPSEINSEVARLATLVGTEAELVRELQAHGLSIDYVRDAISRGVLAERFIDQRLLTAQAVGGPGEIVRRWLADERERLGLSSSNGRTR